MKIPVWKKYHFAFVHIECMALRKNWCTSTSGFSASYFVCLSQGLLSNESYTLSEGWVQRTCQISTHTCTHSSLFLLLASFCVLWQRTTEKRMGWETSNTHTHTQEVILSCAQSLRRSAGYGVVNVVGICSTPPGSYSVFPVEDHDLASVTWRYSLGTFVRGMSCNPFDGKSEWISLVAVLYLDLILVINK